MPSQIQSDLLPTLKKMWEVVHKSHYKCSCGEPFCDDFCYSCNERLERGCCSNCRVASAHIVNMMAGRDQDAGEGFLILWSNGIVTFDGEDGRITSGDYWTVYHTIELEPDSVKKAEAQAKLKQMDWDIL